MKGDNLEFRIVEHSDFFIVQQKKIFCDVTGFLWWRKENLYENWVTHHESDMYYTPKTFKTFDLAKKYIDDYFKYPIYHEIKEPN